jgi:hypothetical protein
MPVFYCIWAAVLLMAAPAAAQQSPPPLEKTAYNVFLRGSSVGREDVTVVSSADGTIITSEGRLGAPFNAVTRHAQIKYGPDWSPLAYELEGSVNGSEVMLRTTFNGGRAATEGTQAGNRVSVAQDIAPQAVVLPNGMFGAFAALTRRLLLAAPGSELSVYVLPVGQIQLRVDTVNAERMQTGTSVFNVRHYDLTLRNPGGNLAVTLIASDTAGLIRVTIPAQSLDCLL